MPETEKYELQPENCDHSHGRPLGWTEDGCLQWRCVRCGEVRVSEPPESVAGLAL